MVSTPPAPLSQHFFHLWSEERGPWQPLCAAKTRQVGYSRRLGRDSFERASKECQQQARRIQNSHGRRLIWFRLRARGTSELSPSSMNATAGASSRTSMGWSKTTRAEDIAQDVFVSALRRMRGSERAIAFKPWIYEIAKNACIDEHRRVQRSREIPIEHDSGAGSASAAPSPDAWFEQQQQLAVLNGAFRGLSERQHTVLVLRELQGFSYTNIAARTGMTVPMVESTLLRARRRLSQEYDDIASGRRCEQTHAVVDTGGQAAFDALGLRERRRFARHIAHCQPCSRYAHAAGSSPGRVCRRSSRRSPACCHFRSRGGRSAGVVAPVGCTDQVRFGRSAGPHSSFIPAPRWQPARRRWRLWRRS